MSEQLQPYGEGDGRGYGGPQWSAVARADQPQVHQPYAHQPYLHQQGPVVVTDRRTSAVVVVVAWLFALGTLGYLLPWALAATRGKSNQGAIGILNLLTGWTLIGWVASLVMACGAHQTVYVGGTNVNVLIAPGYGAPQGGGPYAPTTGEHPTVQLPVSPAPLPPAGWFPDPEAAGQRYWDGQRWTEHRAP